MKRRLLLAGLIVSALLTAQTEKETSKEKIFTILKDRNVPEAFIDKAFSDDSVRIHEDIVERFANPAENYTYERYRNIFIKDQRIEAGKNFYFEHKEIVEEVAAVYGVEKYLLLSFAGVESNYGTNYKSYSVFNAYYTIMNRIPRRANWATKELAAFIEYCYNDSVEVQSIHGSYAGAFGYGQFIPTSFVNLAVDYDKDGLRAHDEWPDVLASIANYLIKNGYKENSLDYSKDSPNWKSIFAYNRSYNYVKVIIEFRDELEKAISEAKVEE